MLKIPKDNSRTASWTFIEDIAVSEKTEVKTQKDCAIYTVGKKKNCKLYQEATVPMQQPNYKVR